MERVTRVREELRRAARAVGAAGRPEVWPHTPRAAPPRRHDSTAQRAPEPHSAAASSAGAADSWAGETRPQKDWCAQLSAGTTSGQQTICATPHLGNLGCAHGESHCESRLAKEQSLTHVSPRFSASRDNIDEEKRRRAANYTAAGFSVSSLYAAAARRTAPRRMERGRVSKRCYCRTHYNATHRA